MTTLIRQALTAAGYDDPPTEHNLRQCFADYVDAGVFADVSLDECDEIPTERMCRALIRTAPHTKG